MIYDVPAPDEPLDQGDLIDGVPILEITHFNAADPTRSRVKNFINRVVVVTQTCDLANDKASAANFAEIFDVQFLVEEKLFKPADIRGPLRAGRVWGWYFLPADASLQIPEMVVDLRRIHTIDQEYLRQLCRLGQRPVRIKSLYREHLAKHLADTLSRIGLPRPYETL